VIWLRKALKQLSKDTKVLGRRVLNWDMVQDTVMGYCKCKHDAHCFDGACEVDITKTATYNLLSEVDSSTPVNLYIFVTTQSHRYLSNSSVAIGAIIIHPQSM